MSERGVDQVISQQQVVHIIDPSDKFRPEKKEELFRDYTAKGTYFNRVKNTYNQMHTKQSYDFAKGKMDYWMKFDHGEMTMLDALYCLNNLVDESDPDTDIANSVHAFQTAERIRQIHPDKEWFHLVGLIHDVGKVMACFGESQWCVVGDTFPVGCAFADECVFGHRSFEHNPDFNNPLYSSMLGIYEEKCGLENVIMSWGHDEYLYRVLRSHKECSLPEEAYYIIRFHSFYPWHTGEAYNYLCNNKDREMLEWIKEFNKFDLYSKADPLPDMDELSSYYQMLIDKYIPGKLKW
ncbi:hypothetical protein LSH36_247g02047 [Paralvinella palmiformis]|uniref:Inositol oxygenase n=1 Tax=Paralvinella palmiformis TaxID=53620 RepID=A0AAD9N5L0_9ANNE|nr:hypothetical protein LSH36_247g02047 [Paralvinella palmiformis]